MRLLLLTLLIVSIPSFAQAIEDAEQTSQPSTRIEADDQAGVIRFIVKGELAAVLDETGLHVREGVSYGSTIIDTGSAAFDSTFGEKAAANEE